MLELASRYWWVVLLRGLLAIGFGVVALIWPGITILALVILFGAYALFDGVLDVVMAIGGKGADEARLDGGERAWLAVMGVIGVGAGIIAFVWPGITTVALLWVIAFWAILSGILEIVTAWRLRAELTNEWMWVLAGLLSIALGVLLIAQPATGAVALVIWIGIFAIAWGIALTILSFRIKGLVSAAAPTTAEPAL
jgi:uncharacterized membrane protein HdeD (DUF308 family)